MHQVAVGSVQLDGVEAQPHRALGRLAEGRNDAGQSAIVERFRRMPSLGKRDG